VQQCSSLSLIVVAVLVMSTSAEEHAVEAFSRIMRTPVVDLMRKRLVAGLRKDDAGVVVRVCTNRIPFRLHLHDVRRSFVFMCSSSLQRHL
jgi:hypothetical protein